MANQEISLEFVKLVRSAASVKSVDGKIGKAIAILRVAFDAGAKYDSRQGLVRMNGEIIEVKTAINRANGVLTACGLLDMRLAYPGGDYVPAYLGRHRPANDMRVAAFVQGGA